MHRTLLCCAALAIFPQVCRAEQTVTPTETIIRLKVQPMAAPKPALRFLLLPELKEMNPGNPLHGYLRCFMEQQTFFFDKDSMARRDKLLVAPLNELAGKELQEYGSSALRQADWAARLDKPDWQILLKLKTDGLGLLLPDVQQLRMLASALKVRFRGEVAQRRFDDAIRTAKTMFALSRHMAEHPTLIGDLVGIAIAAITIGPLEEMLEQPGCPNLYWALTNLPNPFISLEKGMEGERMLMQGEFHELDANVPMTEEQLKKLIAHIDKLRGMDNSDQKTAPKKSTRQWLNSRLKDKETIIEARQRLVAVGFPEERLMRFPADQVILLDEMRDFEVCRDEIMKLTPLPTWEFKTLEAPIRKSQAANDAKALFAFLASAIYKVRDAQGRLEMRIAALRHVEALRLYAADHDGKLPEKLSDVTVPLPDDPFTGKPFIYKVEGTTAHLRCTPPRSYEKNPGYNVRYELTIQK